MKKGLLVLILIALGITISVICWRRSFTEQAPNRETIKNYFNIHSDAEKADLSDLRRMHDILAVFKKYSSDSKTRIGLDLRDSDEIAIEYRSDPELENFTYYRAAELMNDSVIIIDDVDPRIEKMAANGSLPGEPQYENKYIFHKNGDIEIGIGNFLFTDTAQANIKLYIDGATGGIIRFYKNEWERDISFRLDASGNMRVGADYKQTGEDGYLATKMFVLSYLRLNYIRGKLPH